MIEDDVARAVREVRIVARERDTDIVGVEVESEVEVGAVIVIDVGDAVIQRARSTRLALMAVRARKTKKRDVGDAGGDEAATMPVRVEVVAIVV